MTVKDLIDIFAAQGPQFLQDSLWEFAKGRLVETPQEEADVTRTQKIEKEDGRVDIIQDALGSIFHKRKAYALWPKIFFIL